jgi:hypothetical protein
MKTLWCWRCNSEMPMLEEDEYTRIYELYGECFKATKEFRQEHSLPFEKISMNERFSPVVKEYEKVTGIAGVHHNAIMHHRLSLYGEPCKDCGKPLRTPGAKLCAKCGKYR